MPSGVLAANILRKDRCISTYAGQGGERIGRLPICILSLAQKQSWATLCWGGVGGHAFCDVLTYVTLFI